MNSFASLKSSYSAYRISVGPADMSPKPQLRFVRTADFEDRFGCHTFPMPRNVCLLGWYRSKNCWYCAPETFAQHTSDHLSNTFHTFGTKKFIWYLSTHVLPRLQLEQFWFPYCFYDAWRERNAFSTEYRWVVPDAAYDQLEWHGEPGDVPVLSSNRHWLICQGAHWGDPSAFLAPDAHYLLQSHYIPLFEFIRQSDVPWETKSCRAILAAGDHGEPYNFFIPSANKADHPRRRFRESVMTGQLPADVFLGHNVSQARQLGYRFIADVDGFARTWSAWAWKMMSGSTVLSVASPWRSFFTDQFEAWQHFVPVANDCSDLGEKLSWCIANDAECRAIAERARARALEVYNFENVTARLAHTLAVQIATPPPEDWLQAVAAL